MFVFETKNCLRNRQLSWTFERYSIQNTGFQFKNSKKIFFKLIYVYWIEFSKVPFFSWDQTAFSNLRHTFHSRNKDRSAAHVISYRSVVQLPWLGLRSVWGRLCYGSSGWVQLRASMRLGQLQEWEWQAFDRQNNYATLLKTAPTISGTASMVTIRASGCMCLFKVDRYRSYYSRNAGYSFCRSQLWPFWNFTWKPPLSAQDASIHPPAAPFRAYWFTSAGGIAAEIDSDSGLAGRYSLPTHPAAWG